MSQRTNTDNLLVKLLGEIRGLREDLAKYHGQPTPYQRRNESWAEVSSVTKSHGVVVEPGAADLPRQLPGMSVPVKESNVGAGTPFEPKKKDDTVRLSEDQLRHFGRRA